MSQCDPKFRKLVDFLRQIPAVDHNSTPSHGIGSGDLPERGWWVKFGIRIDHPLAWPTVQELGHVLNALSFEQRLPTVFKPTSPSPYLNGGPREYLSWVIECSTNDVQPETIAEWLEGRLPRPVHDPASWSSD